MEAQPGSQTHRVWQVDGGVIECGQIWVACGQQVLEQLPMIGVLAEPQVHGKGPICAPGQAADSQGCLVEILTGCRASEKGALPSENTSGALVS